MKNFKRFLFTLVTITGGALASGCGDSLTNAGQPLDGPKPQLGAFFSTAPAPGMTVLPRTSPLTQEYSVTAMISASTRGRLSIPQAGIYVEVPVGAVPSEERIAITLTALEGNDVAFEFAPHGIVFQKDLEVRIDAEGTAAEYLLYQNTSNGPLPGFLGVYYEMNADNLADPVENFPIDWVNGRLRFKTNHFSGYAIAM